jgi:hypothetical protein
MIAVVLISVTNDFASHYCGCADFCL